VGLSSETHGIASRFAADVEGVASVLGHPDRSVPFRSGSLCFEKMRPQAASSRNLLKRFKLSFPRQSGSASYSMPQMQVPLVTAHHHHGRFLHLSTCAGCGRLMPTRRLPDGPA
jgi:hypothetical protein